MSALRFFYRKTLKRRDLTFDDLPLPKTPSKLPTVLSRAEVARLIDAASNLMHWTILIVLYGTGIRRTEASQLKVSDIDSQRMVIHTRQGKGSRDRDVPLTPKLLEVLREYWRWKRPKVYLFPSTLGHRGVEAPISDKTVWTACREAAVRTGLSKTIGPHTLRHSFATHRVPASVPASSARCHQPARSDPNQQPRRGTRAAAGKPDVRRPPWEVADVINRAGSRFWQHYGKSLSWGQVKVLYAIARCRTAALGGHRDQCARCGYEAISYNSCRNRHCPKCQTNAREKWLRTRQQELLPVGSYHLVFSVPHSLIPLIWQNKKLLFTLLFETSAATLLDLAADPKRL
jgi:hypothetical protein